MMPVTFGGRIEQKLIYVSCYCHPTSISRHSLQKPFLVSTPNHSFVASGLSDVDRKAKVVQEIRTKDGMSNVSKKKNPAESATKS